MMRMESPNFIPSPRRSTPMTRFCSIFNQLLQLFPRAEFQKAVIDTRAERHARGFTCWDQFVAMRFAQLGRAHSLREICGGLASCEGKLAHLGAAARRTKGAVKLHFTLDHDGYLPTFLVITDGKHHEGPMAREQTFSPGTILVFDKSQWN